MVCPASLMMQWENEALTKFSRGTLKVMVYHGARRTKVPKECVSSGSCKIVISMAICLASQGTILW